MALWIFAIVPESIGLDFLGIFKQCENSFFTCFGKVTLVENRLIFFVLEAMFLCCEIELFIHSSRFWVWRREVAWILDFKGDLIADVLLWLDRSFIQFAVGSSSWSRASVSLITLLISKSRSLNSCCWTSRRRNASLDYASGFGWSTTIVVGVGGHIAVIQ